MWSEWSLASLGRGRMVICTFVIGPRIFVRPCHELLVYPCQKSHRRVGKRVTERLWTGPLLH